MPWRFHVFLLDFTEKASLGYFPCLHLFSFFLQVCSRGGGYTFILLTLFRWMFLVSFNRTIFLYHKPLLLWLVPVFGFSAVITSTHIILVLMLGICSSFWSIRVLAHNVNKTEPLVPAILIFGDSTMDTGNNNYIATFVKANFPPYGKDFKGHMPSGRFSNGKINSDMIATNLGVKEYMPPYLSCSKSDKDLLTGVVFASAGSGYDIATSTLVHVIPFKRQLEYFQEYKERVKAIVGEKKANGIVSKALYIVSGGGNDIVGYFNNALTRTRLTPEGYSEKLKELALQFVYDLYKLGARSIGVIGIPPVGCVPFQRTIAGGLTRQCSQTRNDVALSYNSKMKAAFEQIKSQNKLPAAKLAFVDVYPRLMELIQNGDKYGFKEVTRGCCGTGEVEGAYMCISNLMPCANFYEYLFWDSYHPTERAIKILSAPTKESLKACLS